MKSEGIVQFIKFGIVGIANTAVDWIVFYLMAAYLLTDPSSKPTIKAISFIIAMLNSYLWNTIWTFRKEYKKSAEKSGDKSKIFIKFVVVSLVGWLANYFVFKYSFNHIHPVDWIVASKTINSQDFLSLVFASCAAIFWNFFANKFWTYKK